MTSFECISSLQCLIWREIHSHRGLLNLWRVFFFFFFFKKLPKCLEGKGWGPVSQPQNQTLSCLQTLMPLRFHPISMELQQYKTWHPICLHSQLCVWSVLVRVRTREAGAYMMCFFGTSSGTVLIHGRGKNDWFAALCFQKKKKKKNCHRGFLSIVCVRRQLIGFILDRPPDSRDTKWTRSLYFKQIKGHIRQTQVWNPIPRLSALGNLTLL